MKIWIIGTTRMVAVANGIEDLPAADVALTRKHMRATLVRV